MKFVTDDHIPNDPAILSLEQHEDGSVELVAKFTKDSATYRLGLFKDGKLGLSVVDSCILDRMGIKYTFTGARGGRLLCVDRT